MTCTLYANNPAPVPNDVFDHICNMELYITSIMQ